MGLGAKVDRARFLRLSAITALGAVAAVGVRGSARPAAPPRYQEAPALADLVRAGRLPPVGRRLPEKPYVVSHPWLTPGEYGGQLRMVLSDPSDWGTGRYLQQCMYGHSPVRWLRDGLEIGPGLVESWEANADASEWTLYFRAGLKWSDGHPWSTDDIMFWWEDEVHDPDLNEPLPDEAKSGKGTAMTLVKVDDTTLWMRFDAPTPLAADRLAMWVKRGIGPRWMDPKHYLSRFHRRYNPSLDPASWVGEFTRKREFAVNPDCPTLTGWMLREYDPGRRSVWARNPYYWAVDQDGRQLPYLDGVTLNNVPDLEALKREINQGKVDYVHGAHTDLGLGDVTSLIQAAPTSGMVLMLWDGGSGTGSLYFFNYDYVDPGYRDVFRNPKFRQAMSLAVDRDTIRALVYYNTGEKTTGTLSPKALEYHVPGGRDVYAQWRDRYVRYDPEAAGKLLDEIGMRVGADGKRTAPDGGAFSVTLDYPADLAPTSEHVQKNAIIARNWQAIGIDARLNPVPPGSFDGLWAAGKLMTTTAWEVGDGPNHLAYPQWLVPLESSRWAPLEGAWRQARGTPAEHAEQGVDPWRRKPPRMDADPDGPIRKLWDLYDRAMIEPDLTKRTYLVWQMIKVHVADGPFFSGTVNNTPRIVLVKPGLRNVPTRDDLGPKNGYQYGFVNPWVIPSPAVYDPETYYWDDPDRRR